MSSLQGSDKGYVGMDGPSGGGVIKSGLGYFFKSGCA